MTTRAWVYARQADGTEPETNVCVKPDCYVQHVSQNIKGRHFVNIEARNNVTLTPRLTPCSVDGQLRVQMLSKLSVNQSS